MLYEGGELGDEGALGDGDDGLRFEADDLLLPLLPHGRGRTAEEGLLKKA